VRDRVARQAAKIVLEPVFEAGFAPCSYGFRPRRPATQAMERLRAGFTGGCQGLYRLRGTIRYPKAA
jgi:RNA-directed DNA polymerase